MQLVAGFVQLLSALKLPVFSEERAKVSNVQYFNIVTTHRDKKNICKSCFTHVSCGFDSLTLWGVGTGF